MSNEQSCYNEILDAAIEACIKHRDKITTPRSSIWYGIDGAIKAIEELKE